MNSGTASTLPTAPPASGPRLDSRPLQALMLLGVSILVYSLAKVAAQFDFIFRSLGTPLPAITRLIVDSGAFISVNWFWSVPLLSALLLLPMLRLDATRRWKYFCLLLILITVCGPGIIVWAVWLPLNGVVRQVQQLN